MESAEYNLADEDLDEDRLLDFINNNLKDRMVETEDGSHPVDELYSSYVLESPGGTKSWIPIVTESLKPTIRSCFDTLEEAVMMYRNYAEKSGFDVRLTSKKMNKFGVVQIRYIVCSRNGQPPKKSYNSLDLAHGKREVRNSNVKRCGCKAGVRFRLLNGRGTYELYSFIEQHNHPLIDPDDICFSRKRRQLGFGEQRLIHRENSLNIGATRIHKMRTNLKGGYEFASCSTVDFQNFKRDMDKYVVTGGDAQMFVNMMSKRKEIAPNFFFDYKVCDSELVCTFWADETARFNYAEFGDVMSFDATFQTNRYAMIFIPFTVVDNHKKTVVVGAALVNKETIDNFKWVLEAFLKAHQKQPTLVLTDQCAAMKQAIAAVFPDSKHRLCMWHIMSKLPSKFSSELLNETNFRKELNRIVWNVFIEPNEFEMKWSILLEDFCLTNNKWLQDLFNIRESWIPAYFRDIPLCCLMKTTSRSESINSFFNAFSHFGNTLVFFVNCFDAALDKQRFSQRNLDHVTRSTLPKWLTPCRIERHACDVYTRGIFNDVQIEIYRAAWFCSIESVFSEDDCDTYMILQKDKTSIVKSHHKVVQNKKESTIVCSCNHFVRHGFLCRHVFKVLINTNIDQIPEKYIIRRWKRDLMPVELQHSRLRYGDLDEEQEKLFNDILSTVDYCLGRLRNNKLQLSSFAETVCRLREKIEELFPMEAGVNEKIETIKDLIGVSQPETIEVHPPTGIRNKGCGTGKRLIGAAERASVKSSRNKRMCKSCGNLVNHDSRNCPNKVVD